MVLGYQSNKLTRVYTIIINIFSDIKYIGISKFVQCTSLYKYVGKRQNLFSTNTNVTIYNYP